MLVVTMVIVFGVRFFMMVCAELIPLSSSFCLYKNGMFSYYSSYI